MSNWKYTVTYLDNKWVLHEKSFDDNNEAITYRFEIKQRARNGEEIYNIQTLREMKCDHCFQWLNMEGDSYGAIECNNCHTWYNSGGQHINPPSMWEEPLNPEDYY